MKRATSGCIKGIITTMIVVVMIPVALIQILYEIYLRINFYRTVHSNGKFIIFITSDSPNWKSYIDTKILPEIEDYAIILNWSHHKSWPQSWLTRAFKNWGGDHEFNPMAIVYVSFLHVKTIRFHQAFILEKHGQDSLLQEKQRELFAMVDKKRIDRRLPRA